MLPVRGVGLDRVDDENLVGVEGDAAFVARNVERVVPGRFDVRGPLAQTSTMARRHGPKSWGSQELSQIPGVPATSSLRQPTTVGRRGLTLGLDVQMDGGRKCSKLWRESHSDALTNSVNELSCGTSNVA